MYSHILFDLDGTLTDPAEGIIGSLRYGLQQMGMDEADEERLRAFIGPPLLFSFMNVYGMDRERAEEAIAQYRVHYARSAKPARGGQAPDRNGGGQKV